MGAASYASPSIKNLSVKRGYMTMKLLGPPAESVFEDMGNITAMKFQVKPTRLDHYSSRRPVRIKDQVVITQLDATISMTLEEDTARNMAVAMLALQPGQSGTAVVDAFTEPLQYAALNFFSTGAAGPDWNFVFGNVLLSPADAIDMISEGSGSWGTIKLEGDVLEDANGVFFTASSTSFT